MLMQFYSHNSKWAGAAAALLRISGRNNLSFPQRNTNKICFLIAVYATERTSEIRFRFAEVQKLVGTGKGVTSERWEVGDVMYSICKAKGKMNLLGHSQRYIHRSSWLSLMMYLVTASITFTSAFRNLSHHRQGCTGVGRSGHGVILYLKNVGSFLPSS